MDVKNFIFWFVIFLVLTFIAFGVVYMIYYGGTSFLSGSSLKGIKWL